MHTLPTFFLERTLLNVSSEDIRTQASYQQKGENDKALKLDISGPILKVFEALLQNYLKNLGRLSPLDYMHSENVQMFNHIISVFCRRKVNSRCGLQTASSIKELSHILTNKR